MANLITDDPLKRATDAALQGNWDVVQHSLRQVETWVNSSECQPDEVAAALDEILAIALQTLHDGHFQDRWEVAKGFSALGERAVAPLAEVLQDEETDPDARWFAARILGDLQQPLALEALVMLLKHSADPELCAIAATALSRFGDAAVPGLAELLLTPTTRLTAVRALSSIQSAHVVSPLLSVVADDNAEIRAIALESLGYVPDARIPPVLADALQDSNPMVRKAAVLGMSTCAAQLADPVELLRPLLTDADLPVAQQTAIALGRLGTAAAVIALAQALPVSDPALQIQIVQSLGWIETPDAMDALHSILQTQSVESALWAEAVSALGRVKDMTLRQRNAQGLIATLYDNLRSANAKRAITVALGTLGDRSALAPLIELLADPDARIRLHSLAALKAIDADAALQLLQSMACDTDCSLLQQQGIAFALQEW